MRKYSGEDLVDMYQDELIRIIHTQYLSHDLIQIYKRDQYAETNVLAEFRYDDPIKKIRGNYFDANKLSFKVVSRELKPDDYSYEYNEAFGSFTVNHNYIGKQYAIIVENRKEDPQPNIITSYDLQVVVSDQYGNLKEHFNTEVQTDENTFVNKEFALTWNFVVTVDTDTIRYFERTTMTLIQSFEVQAGS